MKQKKEELGRLGALGSAYSFSCCACVCVCVCMRACACVRRMLAARARSHLHTPSPAGVRARVRACVRARVGDVGRARVGGVGAPWSSSARTASLHLAPACSACEPSSYTPPTLVCFPFRAVSSSSSSRSIALNPWALSSAGEGSSHCCGLTVS